MLIIVKQIFHSLHKTSFYHIMKKLIISSGKYYQKNKERLQIGLWKVFKSLRRGKKAIIWWKQYENLPKHDKKIGRISKNYYKMRRDASQ